MDGLTLTKILNILKPDIDGAGLNKILMAPDSVFLSLFNGKKNTAIQIRLDGTPALLPVLKADGEINPLLSPMHGGKVTSLKQRKYDRLFSLEIKKRRPSGKLVEYNIHFELAGRTSNMIVADGTGKIIYMFNKNNTDPDRILKTGVEYFPFKANKKYSLDNPPLSENFADMAGFFKLTEKHAEKLEKEFGFSKAVEIIKENLLNDHKFYLDEKGKPIPFHFLDSSKEIELSELADNLGGAKSDSGSIKLFEYRARLINSFIKNRKKYQNILKKVKAELDNAKKYDELFKEAELIKSNLHILINSNGVVKLTQYTKSGIEEIDYKASRNENYTEKCEKLFAKASRMKRSIERIEERYSEIEQNLDSIEEQIYYVENSSDLEELMILSREMKKSEVFKKNAQVKESLFMKYDLGDDAVAYVGKNSVSNHRLVFQFASASDIWLHAQKIPSAHCIIRSPYQPTEEQLHNAARITASHSKQKNEFRVPVDFTLKKHVKKPKNTPPGFVLYYKFNTIDVQPFTLEELDKLKLS